MYPPKPYLIFVGSYSPSGKEGIHVLLFNPNYGGIARIHGVSGVENPSFLAYDALRNRLFAVSETDGGGAVVSFQFSSTNLSLTEINRQPTQGDYPCYLSIDETGKWLFTVNYMSGSICLFSVDNQGVIGKMADQIQLKGHSVRSDRQEAPHPHSIVQIPKTNYWIVPDLGTDHLYIFMHDSLNGKLCLHSEVKTAPGSGPRHVAFHSSKAIVYVIEELSSTITAYGYDQEEGILTYLQSVSTIPEDFTGQSTCADIHISASGLFLYGSNRGHDSIASFRILEDGKLKSNGYTSTAGKTPRNFALIQDSNFMLVANQDSNSIAVFRTSDIGNPVPVPYNQIFNIDKPVCLIVHPADQS